MSYMGEEVIKNMNKKRARMWRSICKKIDEYEKFTKRDFIKDYEEMGRGD